MCTGILYPGTGPYAILKCIDKDCTFGIREDRMLEMLKDQNHPINRFEIYDRSPTPPLA
jgi:hypothetical protein